MLKNITNRIFTFLFCALILLLVSPACESTDDDGDTDSDNSDNGDDGDDGDNGGDEECEDTGDEWGGTYGQPCEKDSDCKCFPPEGSAYKPKCYLVAAGVVPLPGGYCTASCEDPDSWCGPDIRCVGEAGVFTACLRTCTNDDECRTNEGYTCRPMLYSLDEKYPDDKFCLPDEIPLDGGK